jgi:predicted nucleic acid-binding protein
MPVLLDTNILLRTLQPHHPHALIAENAMLALRAQNETLWVCAQNLFELLAVATRPANDNGLGMSIRQALQETATIRRHFPILPETPLLATWESLLSAYQVHGKNVHDARLVAAMIQHGIDSILTFNVQDFARYRQIKAVHPQTL